MDENTGRWVTIKGTHVLIDENGVAQGGGKLEGQTFKSIKSTTTKKSIAGFLKSVRKPVNGKNISDKIYDKYDGYIETKDILKLQKYDGLPKLASEEEFWKDVKASGLVAQRTYSASSEEVLKEYRNQLYNGEFYVECKEGGAQYGQGLYCAADHDAKNHLGKVSEGVLAEMSHYQRIGESKAKMDTRYVTVNTTLDEINNSKLMKDNNMSFTADEWALYQKYANGDELTYDETFQYVDMIRDGRYTVAEKALVEISNSRYKASSYTETITLDPSAKIVTYDDLKWYRSKGKYKDDYAGMDDGAFAAMLGFDAIDARGHGESGSYMVILNRTKMIMLDKTGRNDAKDSKEKISFKYEKNGDLYVYKGNNIIGWIIGMGDNIKK